MVRILNYDFEIGSGNWIKVALGVIFVSIVLSIPMWIIGTFLVSGDVTLTLLLSSIWMLGYSFFITIPASAIIGIQVAMKVFDMDLRDIF